MGMISGVATHLDLRPDQVQAALDYAASYPDEIEEALVENSQGAQRLKHLFLTWGMTVLAKRISLPLCLRQPRRNRRDLAPTA